MEQELSSVFQANLYLCLFFLGYFLFMRHETLFRRNRAYLLLGALLSVSVPFFEWGAPVSVADVVFSDAALANVATAVYGVEQATDSAGLTWFDGLLVVYLVGVFALSLRFLVALSGIVRLVWKHGARRENGVWVVRLPSTWQPFSFFQLLFWSDQPDLGAQERKQIWDHELAHIRQWHSIDIIFFEILSIAFWVNPVCWLYKQAIRGVHEFLADEAVAGRQKDKTDYSTLLLGQFLSAHQCHLSNHFINKHFLKQRIMKLHQLKTNRNAAYKLLIAIPVLLTAMLIHACSDKVVEASTHTEAKTYVRKIQLGEQAKGGSSYQHVFLLTEGVISFQFSAAQNEDEPIDLNNLNWKLEEIDLKEDRVIDLIGSSEEEKSLLDYTIKQRKASRYRLTLATKDSSPIKGNLATSIVAVQKPETMPDPSYQLVKRISLKDFTEESFTVKAVKDTHYLIEITGIEADDIKGIYIDGAIDGNKTFTTYYEGKFFANVMYKCRVEKDIMITVKRDASIAPNKGHVAVYFRY